MDLNNVDTVFVRLRLFFKAKIIFCLAFYLYLRALYYKRFVKDSTVWSVIA